MITNEVFDRFWKSYPSKVKKKYCRKIWKRDKLDTFIDKILKDLEIRPTQDQQWVAGYIPHPSTYLNGELWEDEWELVNNNNGGSNDKRIDTRNQATRTFDAIRNLPDN